MVSDLRIVVGFLGPPSMPPSGVEAHSTPSNKG